MNTDTVYRHSQPFTLLWLMAPVSIGLGLMATQAADQPDAALALGLASLTTAVCLLCLGRLVIELRGDRLHWHFGFMGWPRWQVTLADVAGIDCLRSTPMQGAGIRGSRNHRLYNTRLGGPALRLTLKDGRTVTLGTPEPQRLADFIQARLPQRR